MVVWGGEEKRIRTGHLNFHVLPEELRGGPPKENWNDATRRNTGPNQ